MPGNMEVKLSTDKKNAVFMQNLVVLCHNMTLYISVKMSRHFTFLSFLLFFFSSSDMRFSWTFENRWYCATFFCSLNRRCSALSKWALSTSLTLLGTRREGFSLAGTPYPAEKNLKGEWGKCRMKNGVLKYKWNLSIPRHLRDFQVFWLEVWPHYTKNTIVLISGCP